MEISFPTGERNCCSVSVCSLQVCNREGKQMTSSSLSLSLSVSFTCSFQLELLIHVQPPHSHTFGERSLFLKQRNRRITLLYSQLWSVCKRTRENPSSVMAVTTRHHDPHKNWESEPHLLAVSISASSCRPLLEEYDRATLSLPTYEIKQHSHFLHKM